MNQIIHSLWRLWSLRGFLMRSDCWLIDRYRESSFTAPPRKRLRLTCCLHLIRNHVYLEARASNETLAKRPQPNIKQALFCRTKSFCDVIHSAPCWPTCSTELLLAWERCSSGHQTLLLASALDQESWQSTSKRRNFYIGLYMQEVQHTLNQSFQETCLIRTILEFFDVKATDRVNRWVRREETASEKTETRSTDQSFTDIKVMESKFFFILFSREVCAEAQSLRFLKGF